MANEVFSQQLINKAFRSALDEAINSPLVIPNAFTGKDAPKAVRKTTFESENIGGMFKVSAFQGLANNQYDSVTIEQDTGDYYDHDMDLTKEEWTKLISLLIEAGKSIGWEV